MFAMRGSWSSWALGACWCALVVLLSLLGVFHDDAFFSFAYAHNGAYEQVGVEEAWRVTGEFRSFLAGGELESFPEDEAAHLEDVRSLYVQGWWWSRSIIVLSLFLLVIVAFREDRSWLFAASLRRGALLLFLLVLVLGALSLRWEWFFNAFHEVLFVDNWLFPYETLTIRLWGGSFFPFAAAYVFAQQVVVAAFLFLLSKSVTWRLSRSR